MNGSNRPIVVIVNDNKRADSLEIRRPIVVKQRHEEYRPVPVIHPVFIEAPANHHKRRPQLDSEEWSSESHIWKSKRKSKPKQEEHQDKDRSIENHHYFNLSYPKAKSYRQSPLDCSKWDITTKSRANDMRPLVMKIMINIMEAASPEL